MAAESTTTTWQLLQTPAPHPTHITPKAHYTNDEIMLQTNSAVCWAAAPCFRGKGVGVAQHFEWPWRDYVCDGDASSAVPRRPHLPPPPPWLGDSRPNNQQCDPWKINAFPEKVETFNASSNTGGGGWGCLSARVMWWRENLLCGMGSLLWVVSWALCFTVVRRRWSHHV